MPERAIIVMPKGAENRSVWGNLFGGQAKHSVFRSHLLALAKKCHFQKRPQHPANVSPQVAISDLGRAHLVTPSLSNDGAESPRHLPRLNFGDNSRRTSET